MNDDASDPTRGGGAAYVRSPTPLIFPKNDPFPARTVPEMAGFA